MTEKLKKRFILIVLLAALVIAEYLIFHPEGVTLWMVVVGCVVIFAGFLLPVYAKTNGEYTEYFAIKNSNTIVFGLAFFVVSFFVLSFSLSEMIEDLLLIPILGTFLIYVIYNSSKIAEERKKLHREGRL